MASLIKDYVKISDESKVHLDIAIQEYLLAKRKYEAKLAELKAFLEECKSNK